MLVRRSTYLGLLRSHERERERWDAERRDLLDRIMYLTDRPWGLPPTPVEPKTEPETRERLYLDHSPLEVG